MFRSVKRRKKDGPNTSSRRIIRTTTDEDDSDDEQAGKSTVNINNAEKDEDDTRVDDEAKTRRIDKDDDGGGGGGSEEEEEEEEGVEEEEEEGIEYKETKEKKKNKKKKEKKKKEDKDKKSKKKMKILRQPPPSSFSFHDEDLDEMDVDGENVLTSKNVGFGSGGGGSRGREGGRIQRMMNVNMHDDDDDDVVMHVDSEQGPGPDTSNTGLSYDKKAIDKLKKEQEQRQQQNREDPEGNRPQPSSTSSLQQQHQNPQGTTTMTEESFISLDGKGEETTTIIAGDDALKHTMNLNGLQTEHDDDTAADRSAAETGYLGSSSSRNIDGIDNSNSNNTDTNNDNDWEEQVSRRALGSVTTAAKPTTSTKATKSSSSLLSSSSRLVSLDLVQSQLQSTIDTLHIRQEEIGNTINRHVTDLEHTTKEYEEQQQALEKTGRSLEEYQKLRNDLTLWCGALRDLQRKVRPILDGYQSMIVQQLEEVGTEFQSWQDDTIAILSENKVIEKVLGRQPADIPTNETTVIVDEFGRDVKTQYLRERDVRSKRRQDQLFDTDAVDSMVEGDPSKSLNVNKLVRSLYEDGSELERSDLLQEALKAALQDLDPTYTTVNNLLELFQKWKSTYPDEYQQCYADLSLGDLATVMLQIRFCQSSWFPGMLTMLEDGINDEKYQADLKGLVTNQGYPPKASSRCIEKALIPLVLKILKVTPSSCIFLSTTKSLLLSKLLQDIFRCLETSSNVRKTLENACKKAVASSLDNLAIPICHRSSDSQKPQSNVTDVQLSRDYTLSYQATLVSQMLSNIIDYFFCLMPKDENGDENMDEDGMVSTVFRFINDSFIYLLSSMEKERAREAFTPIYEKLRRDGKILHSPSLFLVSMPLRAAAQAYGLPSI